MEKPPFFARSNFRCLRGFFASRSLFLLIYTDREPGKGYITDSSLNLSEFFIEIRCILLVAFKTVFKINNGSFHNTCVLQVAFHLGIVISRAFPAEFSYHCNIECTWYMCFQITEPVLHSVVDYYSAVCAGLIRRGRYNIHNLESGRLPTEGKNSPAIRRSLFAYSFLARPLIFALL